MTIGSMEQDGIITRYTPENPVSVGKVRLSGGYEYINVKSESDLLALPDVPVPVDSFLSPDNILSLLHEVIEQSNATGLDSIDLYFLLRTNACKALDTLLQHAPIISSFVKQGHFASLAALLASPPKELSSMTLAALERRWYDAAQLKRVTIISSNEVHPIYQTPTTAMLLRNKKIRNEGGKFKERDVSPREESPRHGVNGNIDKDTTSGDVGNNNDNREIDNAEVVASWICDLCTFKNEITSSDCRMCASEKPRFVSIGNERRTSKSIGSPVKPSQRSENSAPVVPFGSGDLFSKENADLSYVRTWDFNGRLLGALESKLSIQGSDFRWKVDRVDGIDKSVLELDPGTYLSINHGFSSASNQVYVNEYTILMDVKFMDMEAREFTSVLKCGYDSSVCADWYVRRNGSSGCTRYGNEGVIKSETWHRLAMVADISEKGMVSWYVDGVLVSRVINNQNGNIVECDDRWSLDITCSLFLDKLVEDMGCVRVSSIQIRNYAINEAEIERMESCAVAGIPEPSKSEAATLLSEEMGIPRYWCMQALQFVGGHRLHLAREWLKRNKDTLRARSEAEAASLVAFGYPIKLTRRALFATGNRASAIQWLLANTSRETSTDSSAIMNESDWELESIKESNLMSGEKAQAAPSLNHPGN
jgi:hypothetical protein